MAKPFIYFSDWIYLAFALYILKISNFNPYFIVLFAIIQNLFIYLIPMIIVKSKYLKLICKGLFIKISMFLYLSFLSNFCLVDFIMAIIYFGIYNLWLYKIQNTTFKKVYDNLNSIFKEEDDNKNNKKIYKQKIVETKENYLKELDRIKENYKKQNKK